jgi:TrmH family RNA methyltransferase
VDGPRVLATAVAAGARVRDLLTTDPAAYTGPAERRALVEPATLAWVAEAEHPQGVVAEVAFAPGGLEVADQGDLLVVIDGVADPGNVGAIMRTAAAVGADAVVTTVGTADVTHPRAVRASAGALFAIRTGVDVDAAEAMDQLGRRGVLRLVADATGSLDLPESTGPVALVVGAEATGPSSAVRSAADHLVALPMRPPVESLNVAVTAGVLLYAITSLRQGTSSTLRR